MSWAWHQLLQGSRLDHHLSDFSEYIYTDRGSINLIEPLREVWEAQYGSHRHIDQIQSVPDCSQYSSPCPTGCMEISDCTNGIPCGMWTSLWGVSNEDAEKTMLCSCKCQDAIDKSQDDPSVRAAVKSMYESTEGDKWYITTNWDSDNLTYCSFYGIFCTNSHALTVIVLATNNLGGTLPSDISVIKSLSALSVTNNELKGTVPSAYQALNMMGGLDFANNMFSGIK